MKTTKLVAVMVPILNYLLSTEKLSKKIYGTNFHIRIGLAEPQI